MQAAAVEDTAKAESAGLPTSTDQGPIGIPTSTDQGPIGIPTSVDQAMQSPSAVVPATVNASGIAEVAAADISTAEHSNEVQTPASTSAATQGAKFSTAAKSSSKAAWLGKASGLLGRWSVPMKVKKEPGSVDKHAKSAAKPVKVKKEPKSTGKHGVTDVIDLT